MRKFIVAASALLGLTGCVDYGGYGSGVSIGYNSGYGYNGYGSRDSSYGGYYGGYGDYPTRYGGYGAGSCINYDRYGRAYYTCGYGSYYGSDRYTYSPSTVVYHYPRYSYRNGYHHDRHNLRYGSRWMYGRHHHSHQ